MAPSGVFEMMPFPDLEPTSPLKQIKETKADKGRTGWADFKQVVWHESFYKLVESIEAYSVTGCWVACGDGINRHIYPLILILAADYEEQ